MRFPRMTAGTQIYFLEKGVESGESGRGSRDERGRGKGGAGEKATASSKMEPSPELSLSLSLCVLRLSFKGGLATPPFSLFHSFKAPMRVAETQSMIRLDRIANRETR